MPSLNVIAAEEVPASLRNVIEPAPLPELQDGPGSVPTEKSIRELDQAYKGSLTESALWLLCGDLDRSHSISQNISSAEGSFWHGIMHRREGDFGNSKYWFGRVGSHPVHQKLAELVAQSEVQSEVSDFGLDEASSVAFGLVDACQAALRKRKQLIPTLQEVCWWEWQLLFRHCL